MTQYRVIMTVGVPASGKSTWAATLVQEGYQELNLDNLRWEICGDSTNQSVTMQAVELRDKRLAEYAASGQGVVISDTNAHPTFRLQLIQQLLSLGVKPGEIYMVYFPIETAEAIRRNEQRENPVPVHVIERMQQMLLEDAPVIDAQDFGIDYGLYYQVAERAPA